jgi:type IV pilus assembly protein PilM
MARQVVGLKIGASQLAAARVSVNGSAEVQQVATDTLPPGLVHAGEVRDVEGLGAALKDFFKKHKLPGRAVRVGIANNRIGVRTIDLVGIGDPKHVANAVRFRAQEALPIPIDEAVLDFQVLSESVNEEGQPVRRVLLVVAYRDLVDGYALACKQAGLRLAGIDLEAFALLRALVPGPEPEPEDGSERSALVAIAIGSERSILAVSDGFTCEFTRVLNWGGATLTAQLASSLQLEPEQAEQVKTMLSLAEAPGAVQGLTAEQTTQAVEVLRGGIQGFARELVSSLQFYQSQPDSLGIREVVLAGGTAKLGGIAETLQGLVGVPARVGDPAANVGVGRKAADAVNPALAVPIGLGMAAA